MKKYTGNFRKAFAQARKELGAGKFFIWNDKKYTTNFKEEENPLSSKNTIQPTVTKEPDLPLSPSPVLNKKENLTPLPKNFNINPFARGIIDATNNAKNIITNTQTSKKPINSINTNFLDKLSAPQKFNPLPTKSTANPVYNTPNASFLGSGYNEGSYNFLSGIVAGIRERLLPSMTSEDKEAMIPNNFKSITNSFNPYSFNTVFAPTVNHPELIPQGYKELATVRDMRGSSTDSLVSFTNRFDNKTGGRYIVGHDIAETPKNTSIPNSLAVAHFIMDGDILDGQKNPGSYIDAKGVQINSSLPNKFLNSAINWNNPNSFGMGVKTNPDGTKNIIYRKIKDITPEEKNQYSFEAGVRGTPFSNIEWDKQGPSTGYFSKSNYIPTVDGKGTSIPYKNKNAFSRFSGGSGIYIFNDPNTHNQVGVDVSGSVNTLKNVGNELIDQYGVSPDSLNFLYHDMGSFSAKPKAKNGKLNYNQLSNYNTYNKGHAGAPIIIPKYENGGEINMKKFKGKKMPDRGKVINTAHQIHLPKGEDGFRFDQNPNKSLRSNQLTNNNGFFGGSNLGGIGGIDMQAGVNGFNMSTDKGKNKFKFPMKPFANINTGEIAAGMLGVANALIPDRNTRPNYFDDQAITYNPNAHGNVESGLYADGGFLRGTHDVHRKVGGFQVIEETPNFFPRQIPQAYQPQPLPIPPLDHIAPNPIEKGVRFEQLHSPNYFGQEKQQDYYSPIFSGMSQNEIRNYWNNIPSQFNGIPILRGNDWQDVNYMENGGTLNKGQKIRLTAIERLQYEKMGYKFK